MSTSSYSGFVRFDSTELADGVPTDALMARTLVNNVNHVADENAQVRVNWYTPGTQYASIEPFTKSASIVANTWYQVGVWGPWPACVGHDGIAYPVRVRLRGSVSNAAATATFRIVYGALPNMITDRDVAGANTADLTSTSTTLAWLSGTSLLELDAAQTREGVQRLSVYSSSAATSVEACMLGVSLWAQISNASYLPRVGGLYVAEYVGT